jgi:mannose-1-phosphate guanylyltransferase
VLEPSVLDRIAPVGRVSIERATFPAIAADGGLYGFQSDTYWVDAGTFATYRQIQFDLVDGRRPVTLAAVAADAHVADGAKVDHSIVMAGASVADGALVVDSVLQPGARVEAGATVRDSIVGAGAVVGADAVLENDSVLGAGEVADDGERLDGVLRPTPPPKEN